SPKDLQRIANMDLLDVLAEKGDVLTVPREVQHWLYFRTAQSRALFKDAAAAAGFQVMPDFDSQDELPFGITVIRIQSIEQNSIDDTVVQLLTLAERFDGEYDGWETPVVT